MIRIKYRLALFARLGSLTKPAVLDAIIAEAAEG